jgi:AraC family transcriptional activator of pobA
MQIVTDGVLLALSSCNDMSTSLNDNIQGVTDFYREKLDFVPVGLRENIGHFNVFRMEEFMGKYAKPIPYNRKDYFKISLLIGKKRLLYANKEIEIGKQALLFV